MASTLNREKKNLQLVRGFTLIEILVVMFVMVILSASLIVYNSQSRLQVALMVEKAKIVQQILRAKSLAVTTRRGTVVSAACGYGWHVDYARREYVIFKYEDTAGLGALDCADIDPFYVSNNRNNANVIIERSEFDPNLIVGVDPRFEAGPSSQLLDVLFVPPDPRVVLLVGTEPGNAATSSFPATVTIKTRDGGAQATVTVTKTGLVTF